MQKAVIENLIKLKIAGQSMVKQVKENKKKAFILQNVVSYIFRKGYVRK
jgi:hypothetical protein